MQSLEGWLMHDTAHDLSIIKYATEKLEGLLNEGKSIEGKDKELILRLLKESRENLQNKLDKYYDKVKESKK